MQIDGRGLLRGAVVLVACHGGSVACDDSTRTSGPVAVNPPAPGTPTIGNPTSDLDVTDGAGETTSRDDAASTDGRATAVEVTNAGEATKPSDETTGPGDPCAAPDLAWRSAHKTNYESYPDPGSEECIEFNGCTWEGLFAACDGKKSEQWVSEHNIVAAFPDFDELMLHDLCLRKGDKTIVVTVYDTCGDSDCDGCCTRNKGDAEELIDLEKYTNERWGVEDGAIEWADLGPTAGTGCD